VGRTSGIAIALVAFIACGGKSKTEFGRDADGVPASGGSAAMAAAGGTTVVAAGTGGQGGAPSASGSEVIDDTGDSSPDPAEPAAFYWWNGIGNWFVDGPPAEKIQHDATTSEIVPPRGDSREAFRVQGDGEAQGLDLYAQLHHPDGSAVDLSAYAGIGFSARLYGASDRLVVALTPGAPYFRASGDVPSVVLSVSQDWQDFTLPFDAFGTDGRAVANIDFVAGAGGGEFDLWVDDLALLCRGECPKHD
jgi:hypothetical protein